MLIELNTLQIRLGLGHEEGGVLPVQT